MAFATNNSPSLYGLNRALAGIALSWRQFFHPEFNRGSAIETLKQIDPFLRPRVTMHAEGIDVATLVALSNMGMKNGKLVTAETHPELFEKWTLESQRAGLEHAPQLIIVESDSPNAAAVSPSEVVMTTGLLKIMNFRETLAVLGHELSHEKFDHGKHRGIWLGALAGSGIVLGNDFGKAGGIGPKMNGLIKKPGLIKDLLQKLCEKEAKPASLLGYIGYMAAGGFTGNVLTNQLVVKGQELQADANGVLLTGDPEAALSSMQKLKDFHQKSFFTKLWEMITSDHPSVETRLEKLHSITGPLPEPLYSTATKPNPDVNAEDALTPSAQVTGVAAAERMGEAPALQHAGS